MSEDGMDDWAAAMAEQAESEADQEAGDNEDVQVAELDELTDDAPITQEEKKKLDTILDIPVTISMEVGRSQISIRNLLQLNQGSVVELDRVAGEPLDVWRLPRVVAILNARTDTRTARRRCSKR